MILAFKIWISNKKAFMFLLLSIVAAVVSGYVNPYLTKVINLSLGSGDSLVDIFPYIIAIIIIADLCDILERYFIRMGDALAFTEANELIVNKILSMEYRDFTKYSCSHIVTVSEHAAHIQKIGDLCAKLIILAIKMILIFYMLYTIVPTVIIPYLIVYIIGFASLKYIFMKYEKIHKEFYSNRRKRNQEVDDIINGFNEVRGFNMQDIHRNSIISMNTKNVSLIQSLANTDIVCNTTINIIQTVSILISLVFAYTQIKAGTISIVLGITLVSYGSGIIGYLVDIVDIIDGLSELLALAPQFNEILNLDVSEDGTIDLVDFDSSIELNDVSFSYDSSNQVLNNISLKIKKGEKIGICGESGGGKSTLLKLLPRFHVPNQGAIKVDGIDIKDIRINSLRDKMGIVSQDAYIFNKTIKDNVSYGTNAEDCEIVEACKKAGIYDFIQSLPDKFDTLVGPRGLKLSGGQRQRISLARVFLKNPDIVLLDEATSALDNESETIVQESLSKLDGKTIITVAHRLSTIKDSDRIFVIGKHKILGEGTHEELMESCEEYRKLNRKGDKNNGK